MLTRGQTVELSGFADSSSDSHDACLSTFCPRDPVLLCKAAERRAALFSRPGKGLPLWLSHGDGVLVIRPDAMREAACDQRLCQSLADIFNMCRWHLVSGSLLAVSCHSFSMCQCALRAHELEVPGIVTPCHPAELWQLVDAELLGPSDYVAPVLVWSCKSHLAL